MYPKALELFWPGTGWWLHARDGVIGEKMSSNAPEAQWTALRAAGIRQIIDARYKYNSCKFEEQCRKYGIGYFNYPVHDDPETIDDMVRNYQRFSELIADGDFLLMGRTLGLVALAIHWSFSKSHDLYPVELRNYARTNNRVMTKAVPIMHAMAKIWGKEFTLEWGRKNVYLKKHIKWRSICIEKKTRREYPEIISLSFVDFTRAFRNDNVAYDISVEGLGILGYLYPKEWPTWAYDIVMFPNGWSMSGTAHDFESARHKVLRYLCEVLPHSVKFVKLPQSMKTRILLVRERWM